MSRSAELRRGLWDGLLHPTCESDRTDSRNGAGQRHTLRMDFGSNGACQAWVYDFIATSVRFLAFIFLMILRTWTFTVLRHMFNS
jgi:hypothetical protein